jgi:hypothetical protein
MIREQACRYRSPTIRHRWRASLYHFVRDPLDSYRRKVRQAGHGMGPTEPVQGESLYENRFAGSDPPAVRGYRVAIALRQDSDTLFDGTYPLK